MEQPTTKNLAETLSEVLPKAERIVEVQHGIQGLAITHVSLPKSTTLVEVRTDLEKFLPNPRRTVAVAEFSSQASFLQYVERHANAGSIVWCNFDPQNFSLCFTAVIDEHEKTKAGWRSHQARFRPDFSAEWKAWTNMNGKGMQQLAFAEWIEDHEDDITSNASGLPTSLQMHQMATDFTAKEEMVLKSAVKIQSGGVRLTYIADADKGTTDEMKMFERFAIGIPVFQGGAAWAITSRLKYRIAAGKVSFFYELVRPDRVHDGAAKELIAAIINGLGTAPLLMGNCS